ncbi:hypothetical protein FPZ43_00090 [Mucilaginibacter pallidiroseus]|uniref:Uncharacterized protein n=1 Tax=Mucilaginibacter pallidiroseus TaxID=2599295 RepID=A0A563UI38_9SPHI|nr:hypothetical protein [Mucilaginibacter pallidiroseus]TWR30918.1 hypothetical protein FPZ43_00090 [Mucilaginibacter pallidiroseus]
MKKSAIQCNVNGSSSVLSFKYTLTSILQIFIYDQHNWLATIYKGVDKKYQIISRSVKAISMAELEAIGNQIDLLEHNLSTNPD